jgi:hypothetical protein
MNADDGVRYNCLRREVEVSITTRGQRLNCSVIAVKTSPQVLLYFIHDGHFMIIL